MTKTKTKKSRQVNLEDQNGAVSSNYFICRDILWGIVEHIKDTENLLEDQRLLDCEVDDSIDPSLPFSFGSTKDSASKKRKREKQKMKCIKKSLMKPTTETLKTPAHDGKLVEHNIYVLKRNNDGENCKQIVKVIGVGCGENISGADTNNSNTHYVVVRPLNQDKRITVPRTPQYLSCVPVSHYNQELYDQCEADILWSLYHHKPENVHEKYWDQRYRIFSKYDEGVLLDEESWYSITYEVVAKHIVARYKSLSTESSSSDFPSIDSVLDCFAGCGGMSIPLAMEYKHVIAIDWDKSKLEYLRHNSHIYQVKEGIDYVGMNVWTLLKALCDVDKVRAYLKKLEKLYSSYETTLEIAPELQDIVVEQTTTTITTTTTTTTTTITSELNSSDEADREILERIKSRRIDLVVLSPPWGGPEYMNAEQYDITTMLTCGDGYQLAILAASVAKHVVYILPRNTTDAMLIELATVIGLPYTIEHIYLTGKFKLKVAYFGHKF